MIRMFEGTSPRNYALAEAPWGYCPECEHELAECECPAQPPALTPVQVQARFGAGWAALINGEAKVARGIAWAEARLAQLRGDELTFDQAELLGLDGTLRS